MLESFVNNYDNTVNTLLIKNVMNQVNKAIKREDGEYCGKTNVEKLNIYLHNVDNIKNLFYKKNKKMQSGEFYKVKYFLLDFIEKNKENLTNYEPLKKYIGEITAKIYDDCCFFDGYYKNTKGIIDYVDKVGSSIFKDYAFTNDLIVYKIIMLLSWFGLSIEEINNLKKINIKESRTRNYTIYINGNTYQIDSITYNLIQYSYTVDSIRSFTNGEYKKFIDHGDLVVKTNVNKTESKDRIKILLNAFYNAVKDTEFAGCMNLQRIRTSGMFAAIYNMGLTFEQDLKVMRYVNKVNIQSITYISKQYNEWLKNFHPEKYNIKHK